MRDSQDAFHGTSAAPERAAVTRLQAHRLASVSVFASIVLLLPGCQGALSSGTADRPRPASSPTGPTIDAGIILSDRESYLCIPFEQIGIASDASVTSLTSSCECVHPRVIAYLGPRGEPAFAVLLRFVKNEREAPDSFNVGPSSDTEITPANLAVLIDLLLADGSARQFTTNVLRTSIAPEVPR
jgi:hypothetical protein